MFGELKILRSRPIPAPETLRRVKRAYRDLPIDQTSPLHAEKLRNAKDFGLFGRNHYAHDSNPPYWARAEGAIDSILLRQSAGEKLAKVNARLKPLGLSLYLYDAWRPRAVQAYFHDVWMPAKVRAEHPGFDDAAVLDEVERYWAAPSIDATRPAPHATGGAVDLTLTWLDGAPVFMGGLFDDPSEISHSAHFERAPASISESEARDNRRVLYWAMHDAGFTNHPDEWWHYSFGDQMWAALSGTGKAHYGLAEPAGAP